MLTIKAHDFELEIDPETGGSVRLLRWQGADMFRRQSQPGILHSAHFPLVPFCNRIAGSAFVHDGRPIALTPNHPAAHEEPVLHGFGWLAGWEVAEAAAFGATLQYDHPPREWPWRFSASQTFALEPGGLRMMLSVSNLNDCDMPAGLGFHPFFPRGEATLLRAFHRGERQGDGSVRVLPRPHDWWDGKPVGQRIVDTTYIGRDGNLSIEWPDRGIGVELCPDEGLPFTHVYVPDGTDFFCVEPVSHSPEAFATGDGGKGWRTLAPGETTTVSLGVHPYALSKP